MLIGASLSVEDKATCIRPFGFISVASSVWTSSLSTEEPPISLSLTCAAGRTLLRTEMALPDQKCMDALKSSPDIKGYVICRKKSGLIGLSSSDQRMQMSVSAGTD